MKPLILVMVGGAFGAGMRHLLNIAVVRLAFANGWPWSTLAANVVGGLLMGVLAGWLASTGRAVDHDLRLLLGTGLLGGFTTFSAFSLEMAAMIQRGEWLQSAGYGFSSVVLAVCAVFAGLALSKAALA
jgi:fluoride exporter